LSDDLRELWQAYRGLPDKVDAMLAQRPPAFPLTPVLGGLLLIAAVQLDHDPLRSAAVALSLLLVLIGVVRGR
jgi:hypothetical protein